MIPPRTFTINHSLWAAAQMLLLALLPSLARAAEAVALPADIAERCEIWLCAGQSNMQLGWGFFAQTPEERTRAERELAQLDTLDIRLWNFRDGSWKRLDRTTARAECAIGVSFAIRRAQASGNPIAILYVAAGGAPTEAFLSKELMASVGQNGRPVYPKLMAMMKDGREIDKNAAFPCKWISREYPRRKNTDSEARWWGFSQLYENALARLKEIPLTGILWYQGESNATECIAQPDTPLGADYARETLRAVISQLRGDRQIPFLMIGLPRMNRPWDIYREAQKDTCWTMGATYVDTFAAGLGDPDDVHPRNKIPFAELAAKAAAKTLAEYACLDKEETLWEKGENNVCSYRIPAICKW